MKCILRLRILLCLATAFGSVTSFSVCPHNLLDKDVSGSSTDYLSYRLPKEVIPIKYSLYLDNDMRNFTYFGSVSIYLKVVETTDTVVVHSDGLRILEEEVDLYRVKTVNELQIPYIREPIMCQVYDPERQFYVIKTEKELEPNEYVLSIKFLGEIRDDVFGFYRSFYVENGEKKWMAVTQFSPTYARRAFPCMDEPHLKAVFQLSIRSSVYNLTVTSNTKAVYRTPCNCYKENSETSLFGRVGSSSVNTLNASLVPRAEARLTIQASPVRTARKGPHDS
ncbi:Aminopeptidase 1 [Eufriesea mexicana]|uniref:Aminopeptidase 1 n=1 Tax=Eufriesea mexicana TaxID=516756 RepID=A0A310SU51_9HYME|nr:Aminopeptidase 1 [Eufriesea mexicana]